jgi:hypothetical protein
MANKLSFVFVEGKTELTVMAETMTALNLREGQTVSKEKMYEILADHLRVCYEEKALHELSKRKDKTIL